MSLMSLRDELRNKGNVVNFTSDAVNSLLLSAFFAFFILLLCSTRSAQAAPIWQSSEHLEHPLVAKIYDSKQRQFVSQYAVERALKEANILLLGETHSNIDHHRGQAKLLARWQRQHQNTAIVFEMLSLDSWQQQDRWRDRAALSANLEKYAKGWDWSIYTAITDLAVIKQLPILAANLSQQQLRAYASDERCSIEREGLLMRFCDVLKAESVARLQTLIDRSHCGMLQPKHIPPLLKMQAAKDASFALSLWQAQQSGAAPVLISGSVHVRKDIGVPVYLSQSGIAAVSITFLEVDPEFLNATDYDLAGDESSYDFIYFTPASSALDPCVEFKQQLLDMRHKQK